MPRVAFVGSNHGALVLRIIDSEIQRHHTVAAVGSNERLSIFTTFGICLTIPFIAVAGRLCYFCCDWCIHHYGMLRRVTAPSGRGNRHGICGGLRGKNHNIEDTFTSTPRIRQCGICHKRGINKTTDSSNGI